MKNTKITATFSFTSTILLSLFLVLPGSAAEDDLQVIAWPSPPQKTRITFEAEISTSEDVGIEQSIIKKLLRVIFGSDGQQGRIIRPTSVHVDVHGTIYITDHALKGVHIYDVSKNEYHLLQAAGAQDLKSPVDVEVNSAGTIYVSDSELGAILVYDESYKFQFSIKGYFSRPTGLAWKNDKLFVVDTGLHKIMVFDKRGVLLQEIGQRGADIGQFNYPIFIHAGENLFVNDALNFRVQIINSEHGGGKAFGQQGDSQGTLNRSKGIEVDSDGNIYVCDALFNVFQIFDNEGQLLLVVGSPGRGPGEFQMPNGIHIDHSDRIYICDSLNGRIQIFQYHKETHK